MKQRCENPNIRTFPLYGGRGIKVCERWRASFEAFYADMGPKPTRSHSLDRIDGDGNYEPSNCRWATPKQQAANKRAFKRFEYQGHSMTVAEWSTLTGISRGRLHWRLKHGWSVEEALSTPTRA